ncbi:MAG: CvpA family protein [candidate division Zixibacteria bacterium]|nr:CvpA family protein [candidate division Zixibacteria bacterium]
MVFNLIALLVVLAFIAIGTKKGFLRELMALLGLVAALVISTGKLDFVAEEIAAALDASPLTVAVISYIIVLGLIYALFKLLAKILEKAISVQSLGDRDKWGGAIVGAIRGWLIAGVLLFMTIILPLPRAYYEMMDKSMLATSAAKSIQVIYDTSKPLHRTWPTFVEKVEATLTTMPSDKKDAPKRKTRKSPEKQAKEALALQDALDRLYYFYGEADTY